MKERRAGRPQVDAARAGTTATPRFNHGLLKKTATRDRRSRPRKVPRSYRHGEQILRRVRTPTSRRRPEFAPVEVTTPNPVLANLVNTSKVRRPPCIMLSGTARIARASSGTRTVLPLITPACAGRWPARWVVSRLARGEGQQPVPARSLLAGLPSARLTECARQDSASRGTRQISLSGDRRLVRSQGHLLAR